MAIVAGLVVLGLAVWGWLYYRGMRALGEGLANDGRGGGLFKADKPTDTEARVNVLALCDAVQSYRDEHGTYVVAGPTPKEVPRGGTPVPFPKEETFQHIGFEPGEEVRFQYEVVVQESPVGEPEVSCLARGSIASATADTGTPLTSVSQNAAHSHPPRCGRARITPLPGIETVGDAIEVVAWIPRRCRRRRSPGDGTTRSSSDRTTRTCRCTALRTRAGQRDHRRPAAGCARPCGGVRLSPAAAVARKRSAAGRRSRQQHERPLRRRETRHSPD